MKTKHHVVTTATRLLAVVLCALLTMGVAPAQSYAEELGDLELEELQDELELEEEPGEGEPAEGESAEEEIVLPDELDEDEVLSLSDEREIEMPPSDAKSSNASSPTVRYRVHVQTYGDQAERTNGRTAGTSGKAKRLEAIWISLGDALPVSGGIAYRTHVQRIGWQGWKRNGAMSGTRGRALRLEAIQIKLTGDLAKQYDVYYRVHAQKVGWMAWAKNGQTAGTSGLAWRLEAIQIRLVAKGGKVPSSSGSATTLTSLANPGVMYRSYVQTSGWQGWRKNGSVSGTRGKSLRVGGIAARLASEDVPGGVEYRTAMAAGWDVWRTDGATSGVAQASARVEAIQVRLTGEVSKYFDVWYRVYVQSFGWLGWTRNGASAGTGGMSKRVEAWQMVLVPKGGAAPGNTAGAYKENLRDRMVLIGDSRTLGMYQALYGEAVVSETAVVKKDSRGNWWVARNGGAYNWFANIGVGKADPYVSSKTAVVILLGVNDCISFWGTKDPVLGSSDTDHYATLINRKAAQWTRKGAVVYYATVAPVGARTGSNTYTSPSGKKVTNATLEAWNARMRQKLSSNVHIIDVYDALSSNYATYDNLHYNDPTYRRMFDIVRRSVSTQ